VQITAQDNRDPEKAFLWITHLLEIHGVPFQITGGLAARIHGASRPLADIDIDMDYSAAETFFADVDQWIVSGPDHVEGENWNILYCTLIYKGQSIDLCDTERAFIRGGPEESWRAYIVNLDQPEWREVYGKKTPIMPKDKLIAYKKILNRDVDRADIAGLASPV
jgi:hypothetical protein